MRNSFIMYANVIEYTEDLTDEQMGKLYRAQLQYANGIEPVIDDPEVKGVFRVIRHFMDADAEKYAAKSQQMRENASKRKQIQANDSNCKQMQADYSNGVQIESDNDNDNVNIKEKEILKKEKEKKHKYGSFSNVLLTDSEYQKLFDQFGEPNRTKLINFLDEAIEEKGYKYKSHYLVISKKDSWVQKMVLAKPTGWNAEKQARRGHERGTDYDAIFAEAMNAPEIPFFNGTLEELAAL